MDGDLKHYQEYRKRIGAYATAVRLRISYSSGGSCYRPDLRWIYIEKGQDNTEELAAILHELGHDLDNNIVNYCNNKELRKSYFSIYAKSSTLEQDALVLECEARAWKYGRSIAKMLGIRLGSWFTKEESTCLAEYRNIKKD
jgi:hypothetical protein